MTELRPTRAQTLAAAEVIGKHLKPALLREEPAFAELSGTRVLVKYEFLNPLRSFKVRGALNLAHALSQRDDISRALTASTGNHGAAMAFACREYGIPLTVGVPVNCDRSKVDLLRRFEPELEFIGRDIDEAKELLLLRGLPSDTLFVEDGSCPEIYAGTSTISWEIVQQLPEVDAVIVPVGNGALIGGIGSLLKDFNASIQVIGVQSDQAPCMTQSFESGRPVDSENCDTFASGMAVRVAIPEAVELMLEVVDQMVLVADEELKKAMGLYLQHSGYLPEGAGAGALAAALKLHPDLRGKTVCLIASGANVDPELKREIEEDFKPREV